jgi:hypothetical protein
MGTTVIVDANPTVSKTNCDGDFRTGGDGVDIVVVDGYEVGRAYFSMHFICSIIIADNIDSLP